MPSALAELGQRFVLGFQGLSVPSWLRGLAERYGLGGVILFDRNWRRDAPAVRNVASKEQVRALCAEVHALPGEPLVFIDQEGGAVRRLKPARGFAALPSAADWARLSPEERWATLMPAYRELHGLGIDVNLAPVVDRALNAKNAELVANGRCFAADVTTIDACVETVDAVARRVGLGLCLKHYPGLGSTETETHFALADLSAALDAQQLELFYRWGRRIHGG